MAAAYVPNDYFMRARELTRYSIAASVAILYYDYLLTMNSEITLFWVNFRLSWPSFLYFFNRYLALIAHIPLVIEFFWDLSEVVRRRVPITFYEWRAHRLDRCRHVELFHQLYSSISVILITTMSAMRVYALYERNRVLHVILFCFVLSGVGIGFWQIFTTPFTIVHPYGDIKACGVLSTPEQGKHYVLPWVIPMMFDCTVFGLILYKRLRIGRTLQNGMFSLMLRDGTIYFSFLSLFYVLVLINFLIWDDIIQMATLTTVMATILISRLMLNIRDPKNSGMLHPSSGVLSSLIFSHPEIPLTESTYSHNSPV